MPVRLLARKLVANNGTDVDSLGNLGYLAHGRYTTEALTPFPVNSITFGTDSCTFSETCPFVPPLNVPVLLKSRSLVAEQANFQTGNQLSGFSITVPFILEFELNSAEEFEFGLFSTTPPTYPPYASVLIGTPSSGVWGKLRVRYGPSGYTMTESLQLGSPVQLTFDTSTVTLYQGGAFVSDTTAIQWTHGLTKVENILVGTASYMRVKQPEVIMTLQFDRTEYVHNRTPRGIKMYIDDAASGVTVPADRPPATHSAIVNWDQYIPRFDPNFDLERPYWKDRNTRLSEVLDLQRRREHICTLTNKATANFAGPKASFTAADGLPDEAWTLFGANGGGWELVSGQNVLNAEETALVADQRGTYELHFNIYHQTELHLAKPIAFIVAGQSNARGWLQQGVAGDAHFSGTKQWSYGQYYNGTSWVDWQSTGLIDATLPLHHPDSRYSNAIGFDMQFSHEHGYSDVIFIPCAYGGSGFANNYWNKGDTITVNGVQTPGLYQQMVDKANAFFDAYPDVELAGFLWHQGEADAGSLANINNYADSFTTMLQHARNDISAMTANTPVIIGAILETAQQSNAAAFNSVLASIAANDSSITYVAGLATLDAFFDGIHFNRDGYNDMGRLYYQAWLAAYESKVALAFQARVNATGVGPVHISSPASRVTRRAGQSSGDQQVRLQLAAGDSVGVQVAIYTAGVGAYEAHAPAGRSMLALKSIV